MERIHILYETTFYETRMATRRKVYCDCRFQTDYRNAYIKMYYETMVEPSHTIPFSPNVNVNLIRGLYNWAGLSKTTGAERTKATYHPFRSREQSAQCPVSTLHCADSPFALNKMKMVVVRNIFARNDNGHVVLIHCTKHFLPKQ